ncbi:hypothetical protein JRG19_02375 [Pseudoclavibacter alba]|uniref:hypothetical protein n=1 Tax=Pseudoclavibacter albus TaxID=272241 RepID=UPI0019D10CFD|nr:hypothetical protein [Pseudoclavibacter alba]MBN6777396.1 hypothetical protein [Pseudoclavibacter alba]
MGRPVPYSREHATAVLHGHDTFYAYSEVAWRPHQNEHQGITLIADTPIQGLPELRYITVLRPERLDEPTFLLLLNGAYLQRIDVNGEHQFRRYTHLQRVTPDRPNFDEETIDIDATFPRVPHGETIEEKILERCYRAAAKEFRIDLSGAIWSAPHLEGVIA